MANQKTINGSKGFKALRNIAFCFTPLIAFAFIKEEWLARLLAITGTFAIVNMLMFYYGFSPSTNLVDRNARFLKGKTELQVQQKNNLFKGVLISAGILQLLLCNLPLLRDCYGAFQYGLPSLTAVEARIKDNDTMFTSYLLNQKLDLVDQLTNVYSSSAMYFPHRLKVGRTYRFWIATHSNFILQADAGEFQHDLGK